MVIGAEKISSASSAWRALGLPRRGLCAAPRRALLHFFTGCALLGCALLGCALLACSQGEQVEGGAPEPHAGAQTLHTPALVSAEGQSFKKSLEGGGAPAPPLAQTPPPSSTAQGAGASAGEAEETEEDDLSAALREEEERVSEAPTSEAVLDSSGGEPLAQVQGPARQVSAKRAAAPERCRRGVNKGKKSCAVKRGHINLYHINRKVRHKALPLINDKQQIIPEGREVMLGLLGDWRERRACDVGYKFNLDYEGGASWRMYECYVQDRLLWYLYLIGHHFDAEVQILSGLRVKERKTSRHHNGHAVDFRVSGVDPKVVWDYCKANFPLAGIGYYPNSKFVHLDVGRDDHQAYWVDKSGSGESASYKRGVSQEQRGKAQARQAGMIATIQKSLHAHYKAFKTRKARHAALEATKAKRLAAKRARDKKRSLSKAQRKVVSKGPSKKGKTPSKKGKAPSKKGKGAGKTRVSGRR